MSSQFLLLEDSALDAELIQATLQEGGIDFDLVQVQSREQFIAALQQQTFDLILSDYSLPNFDGISALTIAQQLCPQVPFIFVSATLGEELAIETLKSGATDYVLKQRLGRLIPATQRALQEAQERRQRQRAEIALRAAEAQYRLLFEQSPFGVLLIRVADQALIEFNPQAYRQLGYSREEFAQLKLDQIQIGEAATSSDRRSVLEGGVDQFETQHRTRSGQIRDVLVTTQSILIGSERYLHSIWQDITERKQAEIALQQQTEQLAQANRIKDEFLAVLSHELRTPLNPILGWTKLLRTRQYDAVTTDRALEIIERNATIQTQLIEDLLDVSRILRGKLSLNVIPVELKPTIDAALETVQLAAEAKNIRLRFLHQTSSRYMVLGDANRLQQVIWNLLSNAVKFTPAGGEITVRLEQAGENAKITVLDTGQGIELDFLPYIFDHFRQADGSTTRAFGGLGLGLAIVRHLVELHGGTITAESAGEGQGAMFTVLLPVSSKEQQAPCLTDSAPEYAIYPLSGIKAVIVDDEEDALEFIAFLLEQSGATVTATASAAAALEALQHLQPDILISDIGMPNLDGYSLLQQVRQLTAEQGGTIPAIALTAYAREEDCRRALSVGFQKHLAKPIEPAALIAAIQELTRT